MEKGLLILPLQSGLLHEDNDGKFKTLIFGFTEGSIVRLPVGYTHMGFVVSGSVALVFGKRKRELHKGDFFSVVGPAKVESRGRGIAIAACGYHGFNICGGPLEKEGKLRYINGCTDTLLVPPVRKGDACLNHLHFPPETKQTAHTHPSVRVNIVYRGQGVCIVPEDEKKKVSLKPGYAFVMKTGTLHSFDTEKHPMDIITFHPDSDTGMTDDDHPMVNRTLVKGKSARHIKNIRTKGRKQK